METDTKTNDIEKPNPTYRLGTVIGGGLNRFNDYLALSIGSGSVQS